MGKLGKTWKIGHFYHTNCLRFYQSIQQHFSIAGCCLVVLPTQRDTGSVVVVVDIADVVFGVQGVDFGAGADAAADVSLGGGALWRSLSVSGESSTDRTFQIGGLLSFRVFFDIV